MDAKAEPDEVRREVRICNKLGMHARAAVKFVQLSAKFSSEICVIKDDKRVNGKSIMGLLTLVAAWGMDIEISAQGPDATEAVEALAALVEDGFGEGTVDTDPEAPAEEEA